jgi:hypothetical protein
LFGGSGMENMSNISSLTNRYENLIDEANKLVKTFTISYNITHYEQELFSSTYDELTAWIRKALKIVEDTEVNGKNSDLYKCIRRFRGRAGDVTLREMENIIQCLKNVD